jgi:hypothetical protein
MRRKSPTVVSIDLFIGEARRGEGDGCFAYQGLTVLVSQNAEELPQEGERKSASPVHLSATAADMDVKILTSCFLHTIAITDSGSMSCLRGLKVFEYRPPVFPNTTYEWMFGLRSLIPTWYSSMMLRKAVLVVLSSALSHRWSLATPPWVPSQAMSMSASSPWRPCR